MSTPRETSTSRDRLGDRMKWYESVPRTRLVPKTPVLARLDGKAFHTFTRGMDKPVDWRMQRCMWAAAKHLCENIQGCRLAYVQSDETTLLLVDYESIKSEAWFDYEIQKMCSVSASLATVAFLDAYLREFPGRGSLPTFDARFWNLPPQEVTNAFIWRQQDATRNSIACLAQAHFSHAELHGKDARAMQDMLFQQKGINWNDCPVPQKRGVCLVRESYTAPNPHEPGAPDVVRARWIVDEDIPVFTQDRRYVERFVAPVTDSNGDATAEGPSTT